MSTTPLSLSYSLLAKRPCGRSHTFFFDPICSFSAISKHKFGPPCPGSKISKYLSSGRQIYRGNKLKMDFAIYSAAEPGSVLSFLPFSLDTDNPWIAWIVGAVVALPFLTQYLLTLTREVETAAEAVETVASAVENVAEEVEKMAEEVAEKMPEGGIKDAVTMVENLAKETAKDAELVEELMDKVEEVGEKVEAYVTEKSTTNKPANAEN